MTPLTPCDNVTELLSKMVSFNTVSAPISGNPLTELKLAEYLEDYAKHYNIQTRRLTIPDLCHNLLLTVDATTQTTQHLLFESHMDTVSIDGMTIDPLKTFIKDNKLYGRGTCDTKATGASMLWALIDYAKQDHRPRHVSLLFTINEETGMTGIKRFVSDQLQSLEIKPTGAIVGEPTLLQPVTAHNGVCGFSLKAKGIAAHSSAPHQGRSAITDIIAVIQHIEQRYIPTLKDYSHPLTGEPQCSINTLRAGSQFNIIPHQASASIDRRVLPNESAEQIKADFQAILQTVKAQYPELNASITPGAAQAPPLSDHNNQALLKQIRSVLASFNLPTQAIGAPYATDAGHLSQAGIPTIVLGPGDITQAHTKDEFICLDQLRAAPPMYLALMNTP